MPVDPFDNPSHADSVAKLAYQLWESRGRPAGSADHDWREAEAMLAESKPLTTPAAHPVGKAASAAPRTQELRPAPVGQTKKPAQTKAPAQTKKPAAVDAADKAPRKPRAKKVGARDAERPNSPS